MTPIQICLNQIALYDALEKEGVIFNSAEQRINAGVPGEVDAGLLGISRTASVITADRLTYDPAGGTVGYNATVFRADRYAFYVRMYRRNDQGLPAWTRPS